MICTECFYFSIDRLYYKYKKDYIKLTVCPRCDKIADKYIEYDNVILFIDTLLLKKQAYLHLAYNNTESQMLMDPHTHPHSSQEAGLISAMIRGSLARYRHLYRLLIMFTLFHVYLTWAYEEKKQVHSFIMEYVLTQHPGMQYIASVVQLLLEQAALHLTIQVLFRTCLGWGTICNTNLDEPYQRGYHIAVLSKTIMVSQSIKLFPILMLIWPYDNTTILAPLINLIGFVNTIEALRIITQYRYASIILVMLIALLLQSTVWTLLLGLCASFASNISARSILERELAYSCDMSALKTFYHEALSAGYGAIGRTE